MLKFLKNLFSPVKPELQNATDKELLLDAGRAFNELKEKSNSFKGAAAKSGGQPFLLGCMVTELDADINMAADNALEKLKELERRFKEREDAE